jgi:hypothetical protein
MSTKSAGWPSLRGMLVFFAFLVAIFPALVRADEVQVIDLAIFQSLQSPSCGNSCAINFAASFDVNTVTGAILPGSMIFFESDPYSFGPFTAPTAVAGAATNFSSSTTQWVFQIAFNEFQFGSSPRYPQIGIYPAKDTLLLCAGGCSSNGNVFPGFTTADSGFLQIKAVPEPAMLPLLGVGVGTLFLVTRRRRRGDVNGGPA